MSKPDIALPPPALPSGLPKVTVTVTPNGATYTIADGASSGEVTAINAVMVPWIAEYDTAPLPAVPSNGLSHWAESEPTTDILADIDDTLAEWHVSADSMRWRPEGPDTPVSGSLPALSDILSTFSANTEPCTLSLRGLDEAIAALLPEGLQFTREPIHLVPEPPVSTLYDRWLQHRICAAYGFTRAQIGLEGPSFLDARYRQRNRRKRRR